MMARLVFLGRLADLAGGAEREVAPGPLAEVVAQLGAELAQALAGPRIRLALNGALVAGEGLVLKAGDELAFLPPVSGG
ncbi:MoaD/ThiS family protein [Novosphingobium sp. KACC 22771]|uniref:MoaD/ThiS family protein n=1 Tax=Novosphingobium sp. KACC 22771 TaxID=3025670 RepID=UPI0023666F8D|nr:MoaD/ThiS family protein [Novosphingobium sp. KACC 22771]WDF72232.1 MoaD/ThiS family protein [Novosphingobium sp. KACC 22771]